MQDDIQDAVNTGQVQLLRVALSWRHPCCADHSLHEALRQAHGPAVALLLQNGADPNARCPALDRGNELPLQIAVTCTSSFHQSERCQVVEALLEYGADPNARRGDQENNTPLHDAVRRGDLGVVHTLLRYGAQPNALNGFGEPPLVFALRPAGSDFAPTLAVRGLVEALLQAGACPLDSEGNGWHELPAAAAADGEVRALLERTARWWRYRHLAWVHSRGQDSAIVDMLEYPELLDRVKSFF